MDKIKQLILAKFKDKNQVKAGEIVKAVMFSRTFVNQAFRELCDEGRIIKMGAKRGSFYILANRSSIETAKKGITKFHIILENHGLAEDVILDRIKRETGIFIGLHENVIGILDYAFLEMLNNAIDHSGSAEIEIRFERHDSNHLVHFEIVDRGVGVFNNIQKKFKLPDNMAAINELLKGKRTTAPSEHTGYGIFFTSKLADSFMITSYKKCLRYNNLIDDIFIEDHREFVGSRVAFYVSTKTKRTAQEVFSAYADSKDEFSFNKTSVVVRLYRVGDNLLSRSEARQIVSGLDQFSEVVLDFKGVNTVSQAFADEIFRVWQNHHPEIKIKYINAGENVVFMIGRANR